MAVERNCPDCDATVLSSDHYCAFCAVELSTLDNCQSCANYLKREANVIACHHCGAKTSEHIHAVLYNRLDYATSNNLVITFEYTNFRDETHLRQVSPVFCFPKFLLGFDAVRSDFRLFKIENIKELIVTKMHSDLFNILDVPDWLLNPDVGYYTIKDYCDEELSGSEEPDIIYNRHLSIAWNLLESHDLDSKHRIKRFSVDIKSIVIISSRIFCPTCNGKLNIFTIGYSQEKSTKRFACFTCIPCGEALPLSKMYSLLTGPMLSTFTDEILTTNPFMNALLKSGLVQKDFDLTVGRVKSHYDFTAPAFEYKRDWERGLFELERIDFIPCCPAPEGYDDDVECSDTFKIDLYYSLHIADHSMELLERQILYSQCCDQINEYGELDITDIDYSEYEPFSINFDWISQSYSYEENALYYEWVSDPEEYGKEYWYPEDDEEYSHSEAYSYIYDNNPDDEYLDDFPVVGLSNNNEGNNGTSFTGNDLNGVVVRSLSAYSYWSSLSNADSQLLKEQVEDLLLTLTDRESIVLQLLFGLEDGRQRTYPEVGRQFGITRERVRQIEAKALRKLRHPTRARTVRDFLE